MRERHLRALAECVYAGWEHEQRGSAALLGRLPRAVVRPPLVKIREPEIARIRQALIEAGLLDASGERRDAA